MKPGKIWKTRCIQNNILMKYLVDKAKKVGKMQSINICQIEQ